MFQVTIFRVGLALLDGVEGTGGGDGSFGVSQCADDVWDLRVEGFLESLLKRLKESFASEALKALVWRGAVAELRTARGARSAQPRRRRKRCLAR